MLLEPKPREPMAHQYNFDAETTLGFLEHHGLIDEYALNLEANHGTLAGHSGEHEVEAAVARGKLGSIDANRNEALLGWDTDMFPTDPALSTYIMKRVVEQGGLQPGGLNFDAKVWWLAMPTILATCCACDAYYICCAYYACCTYCGSAWAPRCGGRAPNLP